MPKPITQTNSSYHQGGIEDLPAVHLQLSQDLQVAQAHLGCCERVLRLAREETQFRHRQLQDILWCRTRYLTNTSSSAWTGNRGVRGLSHVAQWAPGTPGQSAAGHTMQGDQGAWAQSSRSRRKAPSDKQGGDPQREDAASGLCDPGLHATFCRGSSSIWFRFRW